MTELFLLILIICRFLSFYTVCNSTFLLFYLVPKKMRDSLVDSDERMPVRNGPGEHHRSRREIIRKEINIWKTNIIPYTFKNGASKQMFSIKCVSKRYSSQWMEIIFKCNVYLNKRLLKTKELKTYIRSYTFQRWMAKFQGGD